PAQSNRSTSLPETLGAGFEPRLFFVGALPVQHAVAIGKAAEARDDVVMPAGILRGALEHGTLGLAAGGGKRLALAHAFTLRVEVLGLLVGHEQEHALERRELLQPALRRRAARERKRAFVTREGLRSAAMNVPRELVKQQH